MGLEIVDDYVIIDQNSTRYLNTTTSGNPKTIKLNIDGDMLDLTSIFTRLKSVSWQRRHRGVRERGDNCPLIYAMKKKEGLKVAPRTVAEVARIGKEIIKNCSYPSGLQGSIALLCTPSSHDIVKYTARRLARFINANVYYDAFSKATISSAVNQIASEYQKTTSTYLKKDLSQISRKLKKIGHETNFLNPLPLKEVPIELRTYITPLSSLTCSPTEDTLIIVDDLVASGCTFMNAASLLQQHNPSAKIHCFSLFGKV